LKYAFSNKHIRELYILHAFLRNQIHNKSLLSLSFVYIVG
jgi:hypothetical protein